MLHPAKSSLKLIANRGNAFGSATQLLYVHEEISSYADICETRNVPFTSFIQ